LRPTRRLAVEVLAAVLAFWAGARVDVAAEPLDFVLTVVVLVVITNSFNLLDNMDGALGVIGTTTALALVGAALLEGQVLVGGLGALVAGACLGFLVYNWHPAKIFLGDTGSLFLGFLLAAIALKLRFVVAPPESVAAVGLLLGPALFDTTLVVVSRARARRPIYVGGTDHCSHRLLLLGLGTRSVAALLAAATAGCGALGLAVGRAVLPAAPLAAGAATVGVVVLVALLRVPVYDGRAGRDVDIRARAVRLPAAVD
jgi:UDP-GlcNAc:undecaprenyl-phosphate/decaprenyl-phosphate GlcNAc-1-phosphate transferase